MIVHRFHMSLQENHFSFYNYFLALKHLKTLMSGELVRENNFILIFYGNIFHSSLKRSSVFYVMTKIEKFTNDSMVKEVMHSRIDVDNSLHFLSIVSK